jgi:fibronectin type 3 domain-containing protein
VAAPYTTEGASIQQSEKNGNTNQQWRLIPVGAPVEFVAPQAPVGLSANVQSASVLLNWNANTESDLASYTIFRSESADGVYNTLAQRITANSFVDNSVLPGKTYYYKIKAVDNSLNRSAYSNQVSVVTLQDKALVAHYNFENSTRDTTINQLNAAAFGSLGYSTGKNGASSVLLNGSSNYVQLPYTVANYNEITIATWVNWMGTTAWQRIFDFGNGENEYMFLTPKSSSGYLYFGLKHAGNERVMVAPALTARTWTHVAVTLSATGAKMYVNGALVSQSAVITIKPSDINPVLNYIGRSQFSDPLFMGLIDDFRIYNYAMTATEVAQLTTISALAQTENNTDKTVFFWPLPVKDKLNFSCLPLLNITSEVIIRNIEGRTLKSYKMEIEPENNIDISDLKPGVYLFQITTGKHSSIQRFIKE